MAGTPGEVQRRETRKLRALRFDAGSLALNLACTVGRRGAIRVERLRSPADLQSWLQWHRLVLPTSAVDEDFLASVRHLREAVHEVLHAAAVGGRPSPDSVQTVNTRAAVGVPAQMIVVNQGRGAGTALSAGREAELDRQHILALIADDAIVHLADEDRRARLSVCAAPDCRMLYLASGHGARRQWCSMSYCGNRVKAANHRARLQARPGTPS